MAEGPPQHEQTHEQAQAEAQRREDIRRGGTRPWAVMLVGLGLLVMLAAVAGASWGIIVLYQGFHYQPAPTARPHPPKPVPYIRDWIQPVRSLDQERSLQSYRLHTYGWVDRRRGVIHIPIDRAMRMTARDMAKGSTGRAPTVAAPTPTSATEPAQTREAAQLPEPLSVSHRSSGHRGE